MVSDTKTRDDPSGTAIRVFCGLANIWNLSDSERASLLGLQEIETYRKVIAGQGAFTIEMMERVGHCLSIFRSINTLLPKPSSADGWIKRPNTHPMFGGEPALQLMMSHDVAGLKKVRQYLEAECQ